MKVPEGATVYKEQEEIKSYKIVGYATKYSVEEYQYLVRIDGEESHISHPVNKNTWESLQVGQEISIEKDQYGIIHVDWDNISNTNK